ncbi:hypothetical protein Sm713_03490 [Streptomyces sp. TS71-3]|nr:hypothetical protein Sm713_03490 [Streptomyces sp. TS71-3]
MSTRPPCNERRANQYTADKVSARTDGWGAATARRGSSLCDREQGTGGAPEAAGSTTGPVHAPDAAVSDRPGQRNGENLPGRRAEDYGSMPRSGNTAFRVARTAWSSRAAGS